MIMQFARSRRRDRAYVKDENHEVFGKTRLSRDTERERVTPTIINNRSERTDGARARGLRIQTIRTLETRL